MSSDPRLPVSDRPGEASSPSASSSGQPAGTGADVTTPSAESTPAETATGDPNTGKPRGLKIGSQRVDYNAPRPAPLTPSTPAAATNAPAPAAPGSTPQIFPAQGSNPPPDEGKRRRRRDDSPPKREAPLVVERNVPLPNLRKDPADIERELEAALAGASFDDLMGSGSGAAPLAKLERDARVQGVVSAVHGDDVFLDLPGKAQGVVHIKTFAEPPAVGTAMEVVVGGYNEEEGLYAVHLPGQAAPDAADWSEVAEGLTVEARITSVNKGGLEATVGTLRAFIPAGQASLYRIEDLSTLVGEKLLCVVTECKPERRNLVLSRRAVLEREKAEAAEKLRTELAPGQMREGVVRGIREFGAFVDLGGVDGLLHISQMSWARVKHPADLLQEGQKINVKIQKIDPDTGKIALSLRDLQSDPWSNVNSHYPVGTVCRGVVTKIMQYGAFVQLEAGLEGMIHISEIDYARVAKIEDYIKEGQEVEVKVLQIDFDKRRIALSRKQCLQKPAGPLGDPRYMAPIEEDVPEEPAPDRRNKKRNQPLRGGTTRDESRSDGGWI